MSASANITDSRPPTLADRESQHAFHLSLAAFNARRLTPGLPDDCPATDDDPRLHNLEMQFVEGERHGVQALTANVPTHPKAFVRWFEELREHGPGQHGSALRLACHDRDARGDALVLDAGGRRRSRFDDLVALTQVRFSTRAKLEMARNYWDEMGRGHERGMHAQMLANVVHELELRAHA